MLSLARRCGYRRQPAFRAPFFLAFRQIQGDAVADARRALRARINRHDRAEMAQGAEEIYRRQAAHAGFVDEAAAQL